MTRLFLFGAGGRMGRAIAAIAAGQDDVEIVTEAPDVYVDFSAPAVLDVPGRRDPLRRRSNGLVGSQDAAITQWQCSQSSAAAVRQTPHCAP